MSVVVVSFANHLASSHSPYLLQHKDNPVDWYPYSKEAFDKAAREHKLIFLSIGYSTCHWCHEMAKESFSDKEVAKILNKYYISIKVDKEQMPHIDRYYQLGYRIVQHKAGGWPLNIILTPDKKPIFFATYIPKEAGYGSKGLIYILQTLIHENPAKLDKIASNIQKAITHYQKETNTPTTPSSTLEIKASKELEDSFDFSNYGFSISPKFPQPYKLDSIIDIYLLTHNKMLHKLYSGMLTAMAKGGIYDQIDGGFFRYSVDKRWQIPHFEKMLYTNARVLSVYARAYKIDKNPLYKDIIEQTIKELERHFSSNHLYYSASNADSPNASGIEEEGYYYLYEYKQALALLLHNGFDRQNAKDILNYLGIELDGNFDSELSNPHITTDKKPANLSKAIHILKAQRDLKTFPFVDTKINTAWNAMMIKALFDCGYTTQAKDSLEALLALMYPNHTLYHQTLLPHPPTQKALLEDYAFLADALFGAYEHTLDEKYLHLFKEIVKQSLEFYDDGLWRASNDGFVSYATIEDTTYKSPLSQNLQNILKMFALTSDFRYKEIFDKTISLHSKDLNSHPSYYMSFLQTILMQQHGILFLKSRYNNLIHLDTNTISTYPYLYKYAYDIDGYMLCGDSSCFGTSKDIDSIKKLLQKLDYDSSKYHFR
jgi:uncharacterized protein YyaL (SSP411 family)